MALVGTLVGRRLGCRSRPPAGRGGRPFLLLVLAGLCVAAAPAAAVIVGTPIFKVDMDDTTGQWSAATGPQFGKPGQNNVPILFSYPEATYAEVSLRSLGTGNVYGHAVWGYNGPGLAFPLGQRPMTFVATPQSVAATWTIDEGTDHLTLRQELSVTGGSAATAFIHQALTVCNAGAEPAQVALRTMWDLMVAGHDGTHVSWLGSDLQQTPFSSLKTMVDHPAALALALQDPLGRVQVYALLDDLPLLPLPDPVDPPDRIVYWSWWESTGAWQPTSGDPGQVTDDSAVTLYWGYHEPIALPPDGCKTIDAYIVPAQADIRLDPDPPSACRPVRLWVEAGLPAQPEGFLWRFDDGTLSTEPEPYHQFIGAGPHVVEVNITLGGSEFSYARIVEVGNCSPRADFAWAPEPGGARGFDMRFTDLSRDPDSACLGRWLWDFGPHGASDERHPVVPFVEPGSYTVRLTVWDCDGGADTMEQAITVENRPPGIAPATVVHAFVGATLAIPVTVLDPDGNDVLLRVANDVPGLSWPGLLSQAPFVAEIPWDTAGVQPGTYVLDVQALDLVSQDCPTGCTYTPSAWSLAGKEPFTVVLEAPLPPAVAPAPSPPAPAPCEPCEGDAAAVPDETLPDVAETPAACADCGGFPLSSPQLEAAAREPVQAQPSRNRPAAEESGSPLVALAATGVAMLGVLFLAAAAWRRFGPRQE